MFVSDVNEQTPAVIWVFEFVLGPAVGERSGEEEGTCRRGLSSQWSAVKVSSQGHPLRSSEDLHARWEETGGGALGGRGRVEQSDLVEGCPEDGMRGWPCPRLHSHISGERGMLS